jgi:hypothetical protein
MLSRALCVWINCFPTKKWQMIFSQDAVCLSGTRTSTRMFQSSTWRRWGILSNLPALSLNRRFGRFMTSMSRFILLPFCNITQFKRRNVWRDIPRARTSSTAKMNFIFHFQKSVGLYRNKKILWFSFQNRTNKIYIIILERTYVYSLHLWNSHWRQLSKMNTWRPKIFLSIEPLQS